MADMQQAKQVENVDECQDGSCAHHSYAPEKENIRRRLRRIEGQVRGLQRMVNEDRYCVDVLIQVGAVRSALKQVGTILLEHHTRGCVREAIEQGEDADERVTELLDVVRRFTD